MFVSLINTDMSLESSLLSIILLLYLGSLDLIISIENLSARIVTQHGEKKLLRKIRYVFLVKKKKGVRNEKILKGIMHDQDFLRLD